MPLSSGYTAGCVFPNPPHCCIQFPPLYILLSFNSVVPNRGAGPPPKGHKEKPQGLKCGLRKTVATPTALILLCTEHFKGRNTVYVCNANKTPKRCRQLNVSLTATFAKMICISAKHRVRNSNFHANFLLNLLISRHHS